MKINEITGDTISINKINSKYAWEITPTTNPAIIAKDPKFIEALLSNETVVFWIEKSNPKYYRQLYKILKSLGFISKTGRMIVPADPEMIHTLRYRKYFTYKHEILKPFEIRVQEEGINCLTQWDKFDPKHYALVQFQGQGIVKNILSPGF